MSKSRHRICPAIEKTVDELEGFAPSPAGATTVDEEIRRARSTPLRALDAAQVRLLLSQKIAPQFVMPLALRLLERDPWICATFYSGDVLAALVRLERAFWPPGSEWGPRVARVVAAAVDAYAQLDEWDRDEELLAKIKRYQATLPGRR